MVIHKKNPLSIQISFEKLEKKLMSSWKNLSTNFYFINDDDDNIVKQRKSLQQKQNMWDVYNGLPKVL